MTEYSELYDFIVKHIREYESKTEDLRESRAKMIPLRLRMYRTKHGLTKEALAKELGVTRMQLFRWEKGSYLPGAEAMKKMEEKGIVESIE